VGAKRFFSAVRSGGYAVKNPVDKRLDTSPAGRIIKDVMRHQLGEGEEVKQWQKKVGERPVTGSQKNEPAPDELADDEIDPADFFDPDEFRVRRGALKSLDS
jgi:hypothetical protein